MSHVVVAGRGAWGTALAHLARKAGHSVSLWGRADGAPYQGAADALILAVPAQAVDAVLKAFVIPPAAAVIIAAKGIERSTGLFMHQVAARCLPHNPVLILSGPSFAADVENNLPTAVTLAAASLQQARVWAQALAQPSFRIYASDDLMGVAIGGSLKNVLAIACGVSDGKKLGDSARAALTARGFAELQRLGAALGARPQTLMGLSGLGDLLLTCSSPQSRNYAFGQRLGRGASVAEALAASEGVVEGVFTAKAARELASRHRVDMPISETVCAIIEDGVRPEDAIRQLLARPAADETSSLAG